MTQSHTLNLKIPIDTYITPFLFLSSRSAVNLAIFFY